MPAIFWFKGGANLKPNSVLHVIEAVTDWIGKITSFLMLAIIGYMIAAAIMRYWFHIGINYLTVVPNLFFVYVCLGAAYAYNQRAFVSVDIFYRRFSPRKRAALDLFTSIFLFIFVIALIQTSSMFALPALAKFKFDFTMLFDPARWPTVIIFPAGPILLLIAGALRFIRNVMVLLGAAEETDSEKVESPLEEEESAR